MAYCEVVTKIGNEFEKLDINDPPAYRACESPPPPPAAGGGGGGVCCGLGAAHGPAIISGIMDDLIEEAVCASEGVEPPPHHHAHSHPHQLLGHRGQQQQQQQQQRPPLHPDVGDVLAGVVCSTSALPTGDKQLMAEGAAAEEEKGTRGVGDQLAAAQEEVVPVRETASCTTRHPPVEKKSRLTDLVKNSKQVLSKFILNESLKVKHDEWEEKNEKELSVVDLEEGREAAAAAAAMATVAAAAAAAASSKCPYRLAAGLLPNRLPEDAEDVLRCMDEGRAEGRASTLGRGGPHEASSVAGLAGATAKKTLTFPAGGTRGLRGRFSMMKLTGGAGAAPETADVASGVGGVGGGGLLDARKRKWNLGSRLINYIRKRSTRARRDSEREEAKQ